MKTQPDVEYKGRTYRCMWIGNTRTGKHMAKLAFLNGSKEFWVESAKLGRVTAAKPTSSRGIENEYKRRYGWDGVRGSSSYYSSGMYDEES